VSHFFLRTPHHVESTILQKHLFFSFFSLYQIYPARAPQANSSQLGNILEELYMSAGSGRGGAAQAGYQILALTSSLLFGLLGGAITGSFEN